MSDDWSRPHWQPTGRSATLFYFVVGEPPTQGLNLSRSRHHVAGFPRELQVSGQQRAANPDWFARFFARPGMGADLDLVFGDQAGEIRAAEQATVVRGEFADPEDLNYFRDSIGVVSAVLEQSGLGVLDLYAARWWSRESWLARFVEQSTFAIGDHIQIVSSDDELLQPGLWVHTRGLRKFGRPDLQTQHVPGPWTQDNPLLQAAGDVLHSLAEHFSRGGVIEDRQTLSFPGRKRKCTFLLTPDDSDSETCHFGNEVLEVVDVVKGKPATDLHRLLEEIAAS